MCLLVISDYRDELARDRLISVCKRIRDRLTAARLKGRPVGFIQSRTGAGFEAWNVRIGRYEPIFKHDLGGLGLPSGLIDFIVSVAPIQIEMTGIAPHPVFDQYREIFARANYLTHIDREATLSILA